MADIDEKVLSRLESKILAYSFRERDADQRKTYDEVFDQDTLLTIYDLMGSGVLDTLDFPIATGKEGNVFRATGPGGEHLAVKIYRVSNATFNSIQKYIDGDARFRGAGKNRRRTIHMWASKEYRNLERMSSAGVSVPGALAHRKNIVCMEFVEVNGDPAPSLKDIAGEVEDPAGLLDALLENAQRMYRAAGLVHADLSEYNVLMRGQEPVIIDVGQAVLLDHPMAAEFLERDMRNLARFFGKLGVEADHEEMLVHVRGDA